MFRPLPPWPELYIYTAVIAFAVSALLMPFAIAIMRRFKIVDGPADTKIHARPTPRAGGVVIFIAFAVAVLLPNYRDNPMKGVLVGAFICLVVGLADDILKGGVPAVIKFGALAAATFIMSYFGVRLNLFHSYGLDLAFTLVWIVGVTSAFNGIDNMDGLAGGIAVIVSSMLLTIALQSYYLAGTETSLSWFGLLAAGLIGANLGFLIYNFKPARVFMGDSGSFFIGFTLSALGVMGEWGENPVISATIPVLILGVPIFDFLYILIARVLNGDTKSIRAIIEHCALDHLSHRLMWIGFTQAKAVAFIYVMCFVLGISGILLRNSQEPFDSILALVQGASIAFLIVILMASASRRHGQTTSIETERLRRAVDSAKPDNRHTSRSA